MDLNQLGSSITAAGIASAALQFLKGRKWFPLVSEESAKGVKIFFSAVAAFLTASGIAYQWNPDAHTLILTNLSVTAVVHHLWAVGQQYLFQEAWYQKLLKNGKPV